MYRFANSKRWALLFLQTSEFYSEHTTNIVDSQSEIFKRQLRTITQQGLWGFRFASQNYEGQWRLPHEWLALVGQTFDTLFL